MSKKNRLLIINSACNYGSTGKIVEQIGLLAKANDWEVCVAHSSRYSSNSSLESFRIGSSFSEMCHAFVSFVFDRHGFASYFPTKRLIRKIKEYKPDVINLHNIHGYYINIPLLINFLSRNRTPIVWTLHDCWPITGHCSYFDMVSCSKWKSLCTHCPGLYIYPKSIWDNSSLNYKQKKALFQSLSRLILVPVSEWLGSILNNSFLSCFPTHVIHNGIDIGVFRIKKNSLREQLGLVGKFVVLGVSSNGFAGRKGLSDFIKLSSQLSDEYQIIMIGMKNNEIDLVTSRIIGLKRTSNIEELVDYYNLADVFINPTYSDNFPTTNIEALACGTPVITYRTGGSPEAVDSKTGIVVEQGDLNSLIDAIKHIKDYPLLAADCRKRAQDHFDKNKCFKRYIDLYESITDGVLK